MQEIAGSNGTMDDQGGSSADDVRSLTYRLTYHMDQWIQECSTAFSIDLASISPVTGYTEGVYENVWLLPETLVSSGSDVVTMLIGPIEATVTIDATGACTNINVTYKNGQYQAGETLRVLAERSGMGDGGSGPITVNVATGSEGKPNLMGKPYWRKNESWSVEKWWTMGYGRTKVIGDINWASMFGTTSTSSSGTTSWSSRNFFIISGWDASYGRGELIGSYDTNTTSVNATFNNSYVYRWYYNSEPGQEVFMMSDSLYYDHVGWAHHDTTEGYNGSDIVGDWSYLFNYYFQAMQKGAADTDTSVGTFPMNTNAEIGRQGYVKPFRTLETKNWVVAGGNKNLVCTYGTSSPSGAIYSNGDATIVYRQVSEYLAARTV